MESTQGSAPIGLIVSATSPWRRKTGAIKGERFRWKTLLLESVDAALASRCRPIAIVLGTWAAGVRDEIAHRNDRDTFKVVVNWAWREGISSSIRQGLTTLEGLPGDIEGVVIARAGAVSTRAVDRLIEAHEAGQGPVIVSKHWREHATGSAGPALFSRSLFPELMSLRGAQSADRIVRRHATQIDPTITPGDESPHRRLLSGSEYGAVLQRAAGHGGQRSARAGR